VVIGRGAREHALAWRFASEPGVEAIHVAPGSQGMTDVAQVWPSAALTDAGSLVDLVGAIEPDLVVVGPEAPLAEGLTDRLADVGCAVFGPMQSAARLETSKAFCREVADAAGIPMADGASFEEVGPALAFVRRLGAPVVVKADGLAAGKGVTVCGTTDEADWAIRAALERGIHGMAGRRVVIERALIGAELSLIAICDERAAVALPAARDYKRLGDGDRGPNTGGMGAASPVPDLNPDTVHELLEAFHRPALREMARRGTPFRGALYAGLMLTAEGPRLLEFNVRFGDPEAQAILPRLREPLGPVLLAAATGTLSASAELAPAVGDAPDDVTVAVVLAADGYPATPGVGAPIEGIEVATERGALVFHGATRELDKGGSGQTGRFATAGGRVLTVVGRGASVGEARRAAYDAAGAIRFRGCHFRRDIGLPPGTSTEVSATVTEASPVLAGQR
jgi:phosphoribosylamine--glycine ligase